MTVNTNIITASNDFAGFSNYTPSQPFSTSIASQNLGAGAYLGPLRATTPLDNTNATTEVQIRYQGIDAFWRTLKGNITYNIPDSSSPTYQIETFSYFTGGNLRVDSYISNQTGSTITLPAITFACQAFLFIAPY